MSAKKNVVDLQMQPYTITQYNATAYPIVVNDGTGDPAKYYFRGELYTITNARKGVNESCLRFKEFTRTTGISTPDAKSEIFRLPENQVGYIGMFHKVTKRAEKFGNAEVVKIPLLKKSGGCVEETVIGRLDLLGSRYPILTVHQEIPFYMDLWREISAKAFDIVPDDMVNLDIYQPQLLHSELHNAESFVVQLGDKKCFESCLVMAEWQYTTGVKKYWTSVHLIPFTDIYVENALMLGYEFGTKCNEVIHNAAYRDSFIFWMDENLNTVKKMLQPLASP